MPWEAGDSESSFLTWPGEPNTHVCEPSHPYNFSPFFPVQGFEAPSPTTESDHSAPVCPDKNKTYFYQEGASRLTTRSNQVLTLTNYHISQHMASTFKSLMKCATHRDLNLLVTTQTGNHKYHIPARGPYITAECKSISTPIISRVAGNYSTFTGPISHASSRDKLGSISSEPNNMRLRLQTMLENLDENNRI